MSLISLQKIKKTFKNGDQELTVLKDINLNINQGEIIALTGPSGAGKTTLMHLLGCLDSPTDGKYFLETDDISHLSKNELADIRNQKLGFVFQNFHLLHDLDATENVTLPQLYAGIPEKKAKQRAQELLELVGLQHRLKHYPHQLSGGQKQRIAIARALAMQPKIILADEPTGNLDSENARLIVDLFWMINQVHRTTLIIVTHEKSLADKAPRCLTIHDGQIVNDRTL